MHLLWLLFAASVIDVEPSPSAFNLLRQDMIDYLSSQKRDTRRSLGTPRNKSIEIKSAEKTRIKTNPSNDKLLASSNHLSEMYTRSIKRQLTLPVPNRTCAAFTIVHNDEKYLRVWLRHISTGVALSDVWILDDGSTDVDVASVVHPNISVLNFPRRQDNFVVFDHEHLVANGVQLFAYHLLALGYPCYIYSDVDELLVPNPLRYPHGLRQYLRVFMSNKSAAFSRALGRDILHASARNMKDQQEPPLNWSASIFSQRHYWLGHRWYDKILISKIPLRYTMGFHFASINVEALKHLQKRSALCLNGLLLSINASRVRAVGYIPFHIGKMRENYHGIEDVLLEHHSIDSDSLVLVHLHSVDRQYCLEREKHKYDFKYDWENRFNQDGQAPSWKNFSRYDKVCGKAMAGQMKISAAIKIDDFWCLSRV
jgi:hypothetical protein